MHEKLHVMKKRTKTSLIVLGIILALGVVVFTCSDAYLSRLVKEKVDVALGELPFGEASCGDIDLRIFSGTAQISDISFEYSPLVEVHVERIDIGKLFYSALFAHKISISDIRIVRPIATVLYDSKHPDAIMPRTETGSADMSKITEFVDKAELFALKIDQASVTFKDIATGFEMKVDSATFRLRNLKYNLLDSTFSYNDSTYRLEVASFRCFLPDVPMNIEVHDLKTRDAGELTTGALRIKHATDKRHLATRKKEPDTWIDLKVEDVRTSPVNLIRKAINKDLTLESVQVNVKHMDVFRDARFQPREPFDMPQNILKQIPLHFFVHYIHANIRKIDVEFASTDVNCGKLQLNHIKAAVENMSNVPNNTIYVHGGCPVGEGKAHAEMHMTMNKACDWSVDLHVQGINTDFMNTFIRPLVGVASECVIDDLSASYKGNSVKADGKFCMQYHGLKVKAFKDDDVPYKVVTKNADFITSAANNLIPHSNPDAVDVHPRAYMVEWKRDPWQPFPLYLFGPCIDGVKMTMLPGLYVHKQTRM